MQVSFEAFFYPVSMVKLFTNLCLNYQFLHKDNPANLEAS